jgi:hypothetical protein
MLSRRFRDDHVSLEKITIKNIVIGILLGLFGTLSLYAFLIILNESFRVMEFGLSSLPIIITEDDRYKSNLFLAGISVITGNSVFLAYIFLRPSKVLSRRSLQRKKILNEQVFLNGNFLYWFTKVGISFGVFSTCMIDFKHLVFFYPVTVLILIVLYFETWKTLLQVRFKQKYKMLFMHLILTVVFIFILGKFNVIDYKRLDKVLYDNNPSLSLPYTEYENELGYYNYHSIQLKLKVNEVGDLEIFTYDMAKLKLTDLSSYIAREKTSRREEVISFLRVRILADSSMNLYYLKNVERRLYLLSIYRASYVVNNPNNLLSEYEWSLIHHRITPDIVKGINDSLSTNLLHPFHNSFLEEQFKDSLVIDVGNYFKLNGVKTSKEKVRTELARNIDSSTYIKYQYNKETTYQQYIELLSLHYSVVDSLKKKKQKIVKPEYFDSQNRERYNKEQLLLRQKYPINIKEEFVNHM